MPLFLKNTTFIDYQTLQFRQTDIRVQHGIDGTIELMPVGSNPEQDQVIDCSGLFVTKSFGCGHHHVYSALSRGMGAPKKNPVNFLEVLQYIWWTLDKCLDRDMIEVSALVTAIACARNGVTFVIDHHASPFAIEGSLEIIAKAFDRVGISHLLCYEISDRDGLEIAEKGLVETSDYLKKRQGLVGLHAGFTVSDETLKKAVALAQSTKSGIHVHTAEDISDEKFSINHYGKRVVERFAAHGVLDFPKTILAHCLHLDKNERQLVKDSQAWVVQNTESNLNNNVGSFSSTGLGTRIMLGTDGMHSDMLRTAKAVFFNSHASDSQDYLSVYHRFRNVHDYILSNNFSGDASNNLVILDYKSPTEINHDNFAAHFIFGLEASHVKHVISQGKLIVSNGKNLNVDEDEILISSKEIAKVLWKKMKNI
jgi:cytosine/adenosine deaminase-related metal-dependent hydrolase